MRKANLSFSSRTPRSVTVLIFLLLALFPWIAAADSSGSAGSAFEDDLFGNVDESESTGPGLLPGWLDLSGNLQFQVGAGLDSGASQRWRGINRLRTRGDVEMEIDLGSGGRGVVEATSWYDAVFPVRGRSRYTEQETEAFESEYRFNDVFVEKSLNQSLDVRIGRQTIVWGRGETLQVTDVLNPTDRRLIGTKDIADLRLPVGAVRADLHLDSWRVMAGALLERRSNQLPPFRHPLFFEDAPLPSVDEPSEGVEDAEPVLALNGTFTGWDASFYLARPYAQMPHLKRLSQDAERGLAQLDVAGVAGSASWGDAVLYAEAASLDGFEYAATGNQAHHRVDAMLGAQYRGISRTTITAETALRLMPDFDEALRTTPEYVRRRRTELSLRVTRTYWRELLEVSAAGVAFDADWRDGGFLRLEGDYNFARGWHWVTRGIAYIEGDKGPFRKAGDAHTLLTEVRYNF